jgi:hypothetical protein
MTSIKRIALCLAGIFLGVSVLAQEQGAPSSVQKKIGPRQRRQHPERFDSPKELKFG